MSLKLHTAATDPAVSLAEAKLHLRVEHSADDTLIAALVSASTADAEHLMGRAVMPQKWQLSLDAFPGGCVSDQFNPYPVAQNSPLQARPGFPGAIELQRPPVTAVDSVNYTDSDGADTLIDSAAYQVAKASEYIALLLPTYGTSWPTARYQPESVRIVFSCGYADAAAVPEPIKAWIKLRLGALYENREAWTLGKAIERNAFIDHLLDRYRVWVC